MDRDSFKLKCTQVIFVIFSIVNVSILIYTQVKKIKMSNVKPKTIAESVRMLTSDPHNKSELLAVAIGCFLLVFTTIFLSFFNLIEPKYLNLNPYSSILHSFQFGWPLFGAFVVIVLGCCKKLSLRVHHIEPYAIS